MGTMWRRCVCGFVSGWAEDKRICGSCFANRLGTLGWRLVLRRRCSVAEAVEEGVFKSGEVKDVLVWYDTSEI